MMAIVTQFTITKGNKLDFYIIIKESGTVTPLVLVEGDTFTYSLVNKKDGTKYAEDVAMTISDAINGEIKGTITALVSETLPVKKGSAEDGYIARPNIRLVVNGITAAQGEFVAAIENVYVVVG
jgi:hypothetical protein